MEQTVAEEDPISKSTETASACESVSTRIDDTTQVPDNNLGTNSGDNELFYPIDFSVFFKHLELLVLFNNFSARNKLEYEGVLQQLLVQNDIPYLLIVGVKNYSSDVEPWISVCYHRVGRIPGTPKRKYNLFVPVFFNKLDIFICFNLLAEQNKRRYEGILLQFLAQNHTWYILVTGVDNVSIAVQLWISIGYYLVALLAGMLHHLQFSLLEVLRKNITTVVIVDAINK